MVLRTSSLNRTVTGGLKLEPTTIFSVCALLVEGLNLNSETVRKMFTEDLYMKKLCAQMVLKNLTTEQTHERMIIAQDCLEKVETDKILRDCTITGDWFLYYDRKAKRQYQQ